MSTERNVRVGREAYESVSAARDRFEAEANRLRAELVQANATIATLKKQHVQYELVPLSEHARTVGVVCCPKCGQYMEVMK